MKKRKTYSLGVKQQSLTFKTQLWVDLVRIIIHLMSGHFQNHQPSSNRKCVLGPRVAQWVRSLDLTTHTSLSPIWRGFAPSFVNYKKGCTRLSAASYKVYQLLAQGRWFSSGTPASSTTKTGRHDIAEILL
jgi:hypothetical protein